ncbi:MAG TPA: hypothetical protein PLG55_08530 [Methanospirillum sp.]|jgi:hypothetical protein|uniref:hypothetical protein n=1 Tax=Methanospirillum sp. TaxID=45200 RepID=UPI002C8E80E8|nr:hypothetical protein [Methanospirillum sp.]HPY60753.1 hypothetical protein [Methanospirillum sp.]
MKRIAVFMVCVCILVLSLVTISSAWYSSSYSSQYQSSSGCAWDPWFGTQCGYSQSYSQQSSTSYGGYYPWGGGWGGSYYNSYSYWDYGSWGFWANGTQIEDVTGVWDTDLLGEINLKLTGDDIIRGSYMNGDYQGYIQGNFSYSNETLPLMNGIWWEEPDYQPPYSAGVMEITFLDATSIEGVFSYSDGTWGPFTGTKVSGSLSEETEAMLLEMPEVNWALNYDEEKEYIVNSPAEENPVMQPGKESTV